jgi:hypothetical protein
MSTTSKRLSERDANQTQQSTYNQETATTSVDGFLAGKVGHKISIATTTTNVANDSETITYSDNGNTLMVIKNIYSDGTRQVLLSAERIS